MSAGSRLAPRIAGLAAAALGIAAVFGLAAAGSGAPEPAVVAGALGGASLVFLLAVGWVEPLPLLALVLPLPALFASDAFRLPPAFLLSVAAVAGWSLGRGLDRRPLMPPGASPGALVALVCAILAAALFADNLVAAARESVNVVLLLGVYLVAADRIGLRPEHAAGVARALTASAALAGLSGALQAAGIVPGRFPLADSGLYRATAGFGWPNELAMFLAISLPFAVWTWRSTGPGLRRWAAAGALTLVTVGLASTFSRGSWSAVLAAPGVLLFAGRGRFALRVWGAALLGGVLLDIVAGGALSSRVAATVADPLVGQRLLLTGAGVLMVQAHPWTGVGPGGFGDALEAFGPQVAGLFDYVGSAHNGYVHVAAEAGLPGLAAFLFFVTSTLWRLRAGVVCRRGADDPDDALQGLRVTCLWSFATAALVTLFEWPFAHGVGQLIVIVAAMGGVLAGAAGEADA